jgi:hypothetical protein
MNQQDLALVREFGKDLNSAGQKRALGLMIQHVMTGQLGRLVADLVKPDNKPALEAFQKMMTQVPGYRTAYSVGESASSSEWSYTPPFLSIQTPEGGVMFLKFAGRINAALYDKNGKLMPGTESTNFGSLPTTPEYRHLEMELSAAVFNLHRLRH